MGQGTHTTRGIQRLLITPPAPVPETGSLEPKGVVYTKRWVVEVMLDLAGYCPESNLVDAVAVEPAAGEGAFLGPMIERLADSCVRLNRPLLDCRGSLIAYELDAFSAESSRALAAEILVSRAVEHKIAEQLARDWIRTGDYLLEPPNSPADFVVGNPPYVRLEDIPEETAHLYRRNYQTMRGRADLYVAFYEAALHQLKSGGVCAFICADRWMRNQYGAALRELMTSLYSVDVVIEMHNAGPFHQEVDAYPAITVIRRRTQGATVVASADLGVQRVSSRSLSRAVLSKIGEEIADLPDGLRTARVDRWFKGTDPWPCHSPGQLKLLRRLEERFPALELNARVGIGVATGNDRIFVTKDPGLVESSRLLKLAMARDIRSGTLNWSGHFLVDPWNGEGLVNLKEFPRLRAYFDENRVALKERHTAQNKVCGWYKTIDRVTHELSGRAKLYIADIKSVFDPVLDPGGTYPHHNLYFIQSDAWNLEVLGGLLMSVVGQFFIESYAVRMRGGYLRFQAQYLRRIRVPDPATLSGSQSQELVKAFRMRDRELATQVSLDIYGIDDHEVKTALGS